jgi:hypothetical protein
MEHLREMVKPAELEYLHIKPGAAAMTRIRQAGPPVLVVALIAGLIGYIIGCTREQRDLDAQARAQETKNANEDDRKASSQTDQDDGAATQYSPVEARARDFYYSPNSEDLGPDEMRLGSCGTGMPTARPKQAASCWSSGTVSSLCSVVIPIRTNGTARFPANGVFP